MSVILTPRLRNQGILTISCVFLMNSCCTYASYKFGDTENAPSTIHWAALATDVAIGAGAIVVGATMPPPKQPQKANPNGQKPLTPGENTMAAGVGYGLMAWVFHAALSESAIKDRQMKQEEAEKALKAAREREEMKREQERQIEYQRQQKEEAEKERLEQEERERKETEFKNSPEGQLLETKKEACYNKKMIAMYELMIQKENEAGKISGFVNTKLLRDSGVMIVRFKDELKKNSERHKELSGHPINLSDCPTE